MKVQRCLQHPQVTQFIQFWQDFRQFASQTDVWIGLFASSLCINLLSLAFPIALLQIYDRVLPKNALYTLLMLVIGVGIALFLEALLRIARTWIGAWLDARFEYFTSLTMVERILHTPLNHFKREGAANFMEPINGIQKLKDFFGGQTLIAVLDIPFILLFLGVIIYIGGFIVLVPLAILCSYIWVAIYLGRRLSHNLRHKTLLDDRRINFMIEVLGNIHTVKAMALETQMLRRYERLQEGSFTSDYDMGITGMKAALISTLTNQANTILTLSLGTVLILWGHMTIGGLAASVFLSSRVLQPASRLMALWARLQSVQIAKERLTEINNLPPRSNPSPALTDRNTRLDSAGPCHRGLS